VKGDSQLIVKQVKSVCSCNDPQLAAYLLHARKLEKDFEVLDLQHIPMQKIQWLMTYQLRHPLCLLFRMEYWKEDCSSL
jgi:hypothetical protein